MPIPLQFHNVIIRKTTIIEKYNGALEQYRKDCPNKSFMEDEHLTRVGFMNPDAMAEYIDRIVKQGIYYDFENKSSDDFTIISTFFGSRWKVDWLEVEGGECWLKEEA